MIFFQGSFLGLGFAYDVDVQKHFRRLFGDNFLTVSQSGIDVDNHFVSLLLNPESKRNKSNFESFVSRVTELQNPIGLIAVDFAAGDIKPLCDFLDKVIPMLIEMGSVHNNVKLFLPLSCQGKLKMLMSKHSEVKNTFEGHILYDVNNIRYNAEYLYVDYSIDVSKLKTDTTQKRASSRQGIDINSVTIFQLFYSLSNCICFINRKKEESCG